MKMLKLQNTLFFIYLILMTISINNIHATQTDDKSGKTINSEMQSMAKDFEVLIPFLFSENTFRSPQHEKEITHVLSMIIKKLDRIKKHSQVQTLGKRVTLQELREQMITALSHFTTQRKVIAQMELT